MSMQRGSRNGEETRQEGLEVRKTAEKLRPNRKVGANRAVPGTPYFMRKQGL